MAAYSVCSSVVRQRRCRQRAVRSIAWYWFRSESRICAATSTLRRFVTRLVLYPAVSELHLSSNRGARLYAVRTRLRSVSTARCAVRASSCAREGSAILSRGGTHIVTRRGAALSSFNPRRYATGWEAERRENKGFRGRPCNRMRRCETCDWCPRSESNRHAFKGGGF